jgi:hypothetical protein
MAEPELTPVSHFAESAERDYRRGLAVVELATYETNALELVSEVAAFAQSLDPGRSEDQLPIRRLIPVGDDLAQMDQYGQRFAEILRPLTGVTVGEMLQGRFVVYDEAGMSSGNHIDPYLDDDHGLTLGVMMLGNGVLQTTGLRVPAAITGSRQANIDLCPGVAIVQPGKAEAIHAVTSRSDYRVTGIWDYARAD